MPRVRKCLQCGSDFELKRAWQIFCKAKCRRHFNQANYDSCFYCGAFADQRDHIVAVSERGGDRRFDCQETVRSCKTCNSVLSNRFFESVVDRFEHMQSHYMEKLRRNKTPEWSEDELRAMGRNMRQRIKKAFAVRGDLEARIGHLKIKMNDLIYATDE